MLIEMLIYLLKYKPANRKSEKKIFTLFLGIPFWRIWMVYTHSFCICQCTVWWMLNWKLENDYVVLSSIGRFGRFGAVDCIVISTVWLSFLASFAELPHSIFRMLCRIHSFHIKDLQMQWAERVYGSMQIAFMLKPTHTCTMIIDWKSLPWPERVNRRDRESWCTQLAVQHTQNSNGSMIECQVKMNEKKERKNVTNRTKKEENVPSKQLKRKMNKWKWFI